MNGGVGLRLRSPRVTDRTVKRASSSDATSPCTACSSPSDAFAPATSLSVATNSGGSVDARRACSDQYSTGTNAWISRSRSTMRRTATDWTRPAERPRWTFSHRSGERL